MRLRLTKRADYAVRACLVLAAAPEVPLPARCIAERMAIPERFLPQVLGDLSRAGIVGGTVGKGGGYALRRDPRSLTLLEVIEAVEGPARSEQCVLEDRNCDDDRACALHPVWSAAQSAFIHVLEATTIDRIATPATRPARHVGAAVGPTAPERITA